MAAFCRPPLAPPPPPLPDIPLGALGMALPDIQLQLPDGKTATIKFSDSHTSGAVRGFTYCACADHSGCAKWRQLNQFASPVHVAAFMYEWLLLAIEDPTLGQEDHSLVAVPSPERVDARFNNMPYTVSYTHLTLPTILLV